MKSILFYSTTPYPYDLETLKTKGLGGVEVSVILIAEKLGEKYNVVVAQKGKKTHTSSKHVQYIPFSPFLLKMPWDAVISVRSVDAATQVRSANAHVPLWIWLHDLIDMQLFPHIKWMKEKHIGGIVVSDFLHKQLLDLIALDPFLTDVPQILRIYDPIADELRPDQTVWDRNKLLFPSTAYKGLDETLEGFRMLRKECPEFKLYVTNPGYHTRKSIPHENVIYLGSLSHFENIRHMRSSLAVFQLNRVWPDTFGLAIAEANAVGTPVLTHPLGSVVEVIEDKEQLMNTYDLPAVVERILQWREGKRLKVTLPEKFRLCHVIKEWEKLLNSVEIR